MFPDDREYNSDSEDPATGGATPPGEPGAPGASKPAPAPDDQPHAERDLAAATDLFPDLITDLQRTLEVLEMSPDALERHEQAQIRAQINAPLPPALAHKAEVYQASALVHDLDEMLNTALEFGNAIAKTDRYRHRDFTVYILYIPTSPEGRGFKAVLDLSPTELVLETLEYLEWRLYGVFEFTRVAEQRTVDFITYMN